MSIVFDSRIYPLFSIPNACRQLIIDRLNTFEAKSEMDALVEFIVKCDGRSPLSEILNTIEETNKSALLSDIQYLIQSGSILDARHGYTLFYELSKNPSLYPPGFSPREVESWTCFQPKSLGEPLSCHLSETNSFEDAITFSRRSASMNDFINFGDDEGLLENLICCIKTAYRITEKKSTVGSAGGLYPIVVYIAFPKQGYKETYLFAWYDQFSGSFNLVTEHQLSLLIEAFYPDPSIGLSLNSGIGLLFICCDTRKSCGKYANRGYRFSLLEAGAVWQNIDLAANHFNIPIRAFGGFLDDKCSELLLLPEYVHPVLTAFIGKAE